MPRNPVPRPNKYNYPLDTPFKIIYVSAQAVENKFSKVRLLPQMSFYTSKILVFKRQRAPQTENGERAKMRRRECEVANAKQQQEYYSFAFAYSHFRNFATSHSRIFPTKAKVRRQKWPHRKTIPDQLVMYLYT